MEGYKTLTEAVSVALKKCNSWYGTENGELYGVREISYIAQIADYESPNTSNEIFYCVFPDGEIGLLCTYDRSIRRLFVPYDSSFEPSEDMILGDNDEMISDDVMPHSNIFDDEDSGEESETKDYCFCIYCGAKISKTSKYCTECGKKNEG